MAHASGVPIRVMIVDDTDHVRRMLNTMLTVDGFDVVHQAASGADALDHVAEADPDVIVIDYKMPLMDGLTTARRLRDRRPDQVVILYTAYVDDALQAEADEIGVALCVDKVEGLNSLEREITRLSASLRS